MRRLSPLLLLPALALAACAHGRGKQHSVPGAPVTLCIVNAVAGYGNIVAHVGPMRLEAQPGETVCRKLRGMPGALDLSAMSTGGGLTGALAFSDVLRAAPDECWRWTFRGPRSAPLLPCS
jgi:hypothetical protein